MSDDVRVAHVTVRFTYELKRKYVTDKSGGYDIAPEDPDWASKMAAVDKELMDGGMLIELLEMVEDVSIGVELLDDGSEAPNPHVMTGGREDDLPGDSPFRE